MMYKDSIETLLTILFQISRCYRIGYSVINNPMLQNGFFCIKSDNHICNFINYVNIFYYGVSFLILYNAMIENV